VPELLPDILPGIGEAAAEGIDIGTEGAIDEEIAAAENRLQTELAAKVNPLGGTKNCSWTSLETDQGLGDMFAGRNPDPYASNLFEPNMGDGSEILSKGEKIVDAPTDADMAYTKTLAQEYGGTFEGSSVKDIASQLQNAGNGSRGIVFVQDSAGGTGHYFNAVNYGGETFFVDGQSGEVMATGDGLPSGWGEANNPQISFLKTAGF
jgi:Papain fold toxin 1, glutamine deamidase